MLHAARAGDLVVLSERCRFCPLCPTTAARLTWARTANRCTRCASWATAPVWSPLVRSVPCMCWTCPTPPIQRWWANSRSRACRTTVGIATGLAAGCGAHASATGKRGGVKVALFDVRDPTRPRELGSQTFGDKGRRSHRVVLSINPGKSADASKCLHARRLAPTRAGRGSRPWPVLRRGT